MTITDTFKRFANELDLSLNEFQGPFRVQIISGHTYTGHHGRICFTSCLDALASRPPNVRATERVFVHSLYDLCIYEEDVPRGSDVKEYVRYLNSRWIRWTLGETK